VVLGWVGTAVGYLYWIFQVLQERAIEQTVIFFFALCF
jgi:hypothetical protein